MSDRDALINRMQRAAKCIYIATDKVVADDISDIINKAVTELKAIEHCKQGEPSDEVYALRAKNAYLLAQLATNSPSPQPPTDNDHVAEGCELFAHAMPKSEGKPEPDAEIIRGKLYPWKNKQIPYMAKVYFDTSLSTPQPSTDVSESLGKAIHVLKTTEIWLDTMPVTTQSSITLHELVKTVLDQISPSPSTPLNDLGE